MIYLDNNAITPPEPGLIDFLKQSFIHEECYANPSSVHSLGKKSHQMVVETTSLIQSVLGFRGQVVYTSGATESLNLAIASLPRGSHVITSSLEHPAVIEPLKRADLSVSYLDPKEGLCTLSLQQLEASITPSTSAIVLGWVNSEVGAKQDIQAIAQLALDYKLQFIVDATAIVGKEKILIPEGVTMFAFSGQKFHALSGIGALLIAPRVKICPFFWGGGQQNGLRSGTENIWGIASLFYVFQYLVSHQIEVSEKVLSFRDYFEKTIKQKISDIVIHCEDFLRVNNVSAIAFPPIEGEVLQITLDLEGIACGYGSACSSGATTAFKSLVGLGVSQELAASTLRFSFSHLLSMDDVDSAIKIIHKVVSKLKSL
ncbi:cysteine desulfurase family protein [Chlamydia sp. 17-3921]|uniref:cysteine desulfurase family protein n=1 Tax=Chlamydia sp. 17-3921 TaxID=2675798 RepID=UPI0019180E20|nr:cysteine desulfurase family protein [Chlamydia sp. 17-3921]